MNPQNAQSDNAAELIASGTDAVSGLAVFGKTAAALLLIIALILLCSYLLRRFAPGSLLPRHLKLVSSLAVGNRERVVIVAVDDTWLVLGVGNGQINKLHQMPARDEFRNQLTAASHARADKVNRRAADREGGLGQRTPPDTAL